jgi:hypothetical protein
MVVRNAAGDKTVVIGLAADSGAFSLLRAPGRKGATSAPTPQAPLLRLRRALSQPTAHVRTKPTTKNQPKTHNFKKNQAAASPPSCAA